MAAIVGSKFVLGQFDISQSIANMPLEMALSPAVYGLAVNLAMLGLFNDSPSFRIEVHDHVYQEGPLGLSNAWLLICT